MACLLDFQICDEEVCVVDHVTLPTEPTRVSHTCWVDVAELGRPAVAGTPTAGSAC